MLTVPAVAYQDAHSNTFVSGLKNVPHRWLSFIHACYALGCFVGPLVATAIATRSDPAVMAGVEGWRRVYLVLVAVSLVNAVGVPAAFKDTVWSKVRPTATAQGGGGGGGSGSNSGKQRNRAALRDTAGVLKMRALWILSLFYFFELGATMTAGGWVVEFLTTVRGGNLANVSPELR